MLYYSDKKGLEFYELSINEMSLSGIVYKVVKIPVKFTDKKVAYATIV